MALDTGTINARIKIDTTGVNSALSSVKRDLNDVKKSAEKVEKNNIDVTPKGTAGVTAASKQARELGDNLKSAGDAGKGVSFNPQVASELDKAKSSGMGLKGVFESLSGVAGVVGLAGAVGGVGAAFTDMVKAGNAYRSELNTMGAVSGATAGQIQQVSAAAKELGNDTDLANTSASDAAAAMTELAKGGFTVEQSMGAAKGTLQLAAAAQIDAASAATIQSQALQAFSLGAGDAARVSDILAGAANASSAEIGDVAQGLQQSGAVAHTFGVSIEDTATSLAMLANAGIQGSDAGTLLKSTLLAVTDQGGPAQAAIKELGLSVYDANGKFVGMSSLMGQLKDASESMTDEQYQAATATLFGSDAMRLSGIAAQQGSEGFETLKESVTRQGQAAEVAAAQTQGLPGAIGRVENAWETAQTTIFEATEGGLVAALDIATGGIEGMANLITGPGFTIAGQVFTNLGEQAKILADGATAAGNAIADVLVPGADDMADVVGIVSGKVEGLNDGLSGWQVPIAAAAIVGFGAKFTGLTGKLNEGSGSIARFGQEMQVQQALAKGYGKEIGVVGSAVSVMRSRSEALDTVMSNAGRSYMTGSAGLRQIASAHRTAANAAKLQALESTSAFNSIDRIGAQAGHSFVATTATMGGAAKGFASGGLSVMKSAMGGVGKAASGLMGALGGPWGLAITGASLVIGELVQRHQEAKQAEEEHKAAQDNLRNSLDQTTGAITEQTKELINKKLEESGAAQAARDMGISQETVRDAVNGNADALERVNKQTRDTIKSSIENSAQWSAGKSVFEDAGVTIDDLTSALQGNQDAIDKVNKDNYTKGRFNAMKDNLEGVAGSAKTLSTEVNGLNKDLEQVKADKLKDAMMGVEEQTKKTSTAMAAIGDSIVAIPDEKTIHVSSMAPEVRKDMRDLGLEINDLPGGNVEVKFPDGMNIIQTLQDMGAKVRSLPDGSVTLADNTPEVQQHLIDLGLAVRDEKTGEVKIKDNISEVINKQVELGAAVASPETGELYVKDNVGEVLASLNGLGIQAQALPPGHVRITDDTPANRQHLQDLGIATVTLPGGHIGITDTSPENMARLGELGVQTQTLPPGWIEITDTSDDNKARLADLGIKTTTLPNGRVVVTDNANETRDHIRSTLSAENTNTFSDHVINITRKIKDIFEKADGGVMAPVETFANGGQRVSDAVNKRSKSNHEPSHDAHIAPAGSYRVFAEDETGGEAYIPLAAAKRGRSEKILGAVAERFGYNLTDSQTGEVQQFADGALLPGSAVKNRLKFMDGTPYVFGGWSSAGVDCSGAVALAVNVSEGLDPWDSRTATAGEGAWLQQKGYTQGRGGNGDIRIGYYNGGPGGGHTALQLDDGTYIESGGNTGSGFTIGGKAGPLDNRGFTDWWHKRGGAALGSEGLDALNSLNGVIGGRSTVASAVQAATNPSATYGSDVDSTTSNSRELNGGAGTLIKDGSALELAAALYSKQTGQAMDDDIVSWGQAIGLYSKSTGDSSKDLDKVTKELDKNSTKLEDTKTKLEAAKNDLPIAEEDVRIKKLKRDETYNKTNKDGAFTATESQKAAADQAVVKAEEKVKDTKAKIEELEAQQKELESAQSDIRARQATISGDSIDPYSGLDSNISGTSGNKYADAIIKEGKNRGITDRGIIIALSTALVESGMKMYANNADPQSLDYPHDAVGSDHDSVGLFQQRNNGAWGTLADRMDPAKSAGMFYDKLDDADYNTGDMGAHAQRVQGSAFPEKYAEKMTEAAGYLAAWKGGGGTVTAMADGGILGGLRQAQINDGSSAVLWGEAGPEAYIPLSSDKRARSLDIWAETGKRLGVDVMSLLNLVGSTIPNLVQGDLSFSTGASISADALGVNMDAASYRGQREVQNAVGAVFNGPVQINDPRKYLQGQYDNAAKQLGDAMRSVML